jgi:hypothetical protein
MFHALHVWSGDTGLVLLRFALIVVALSCVLRVARLLGASWPAVLVLAPVVLGLLWARLEFRPYLFTTALLACQLSLLVSVHLGRRSWR